MYFVGLNGDLYSASVDAVMNIFTLDRVITTLDCTITIRTERGIGMNIRSLPKHAGELIVFLKLLQTNFDMIVLTEIGARNVSTVPAG